MVIELGDYAFRYLNSCYESNADVHRKEPDQNGAAHSEKNKK